MPCTGEASLKDYNHYSDPPYTQIVLSLILSLKGQVKLGKQYTYLKRESSSRSKQTSGSPINLAT